MEKNEWGSWDEKVNASIFKPPANTPFHKMIVPTVDGDRNKYVLRMLIKNNKNTLVVGTTGTGKTVVINEIIADLDDYYTSQNLVFSA